MKNNQFRVENRRNWKGQIVDYDKIQAYEDNECLYCLTDAQVAVLGGIIEPLAWYTRWQSETQEIDSAWIRQFRDDIQRRLMMSCCGDEILYRYDENGNLEESTDGGVTYTPVPQADIRVNPKVVFPPPIVGEGEDITCQAADSAVKLIKEQIGDQLTDDMSRYTLQQLITDWTNTVIGTSNPFQALAVVVTNQIFALLISAIRAALTTDVYEKLRCILQARMNSVAFFDGAAWELVRSDILSQITGIAGIFLEHLIYLIGNGGLSNLARAGAGDASVECDCSEFCSLNSWTRYLKGTINTSNRTSHYIEMAAEYQVEDNTYYALLISSGAGDCCVFNSTGDGSGSVYVISGIATTSKYTECGTDPTTINVGGLPLAFGTFNGNGILYASDSPFTIVLRTDQ